jgi:hypothetical protein
VNLVLEIGAPLHRNEVGCVWRHLPATYPVKAEPPSQLFKQLTALLQTIDCRKAWDKQLTGTELGSADCLVWYSHEYPVDETTKFRTNQTRNKVARVHVKVPSCCLSCESSQHHPLVIQTIDSTPADHWLQKSMRQTTDRNTSGLWWLFGMIFTWVSSWWENQIRTNQTRNKVARVHVKVPSCCLSCESSQHHPLVIQTIDCTPADYRLQKSMGQTTERNRAGLCRLFGMIFTWVSGWWDNQI